MNNFAYRRAYCGPIRLAIFDWAGTTVDYGCCTPAAVFVEGYRRRGVEISLPQARGPMGMEKRAHIAAIGRMDEVAMNWRKVHGRPMHQQDVDEMYAEFAHLLLQTLDAHATLIPGALETLVTLRQQDVFIGGSTGYFDEAAAVVASAAARQGYIPDSNVCATQVSAGRPAPWMIYWTMNQLNVFPPEAVVSIGDTVPDVESGLNAGVWTIGLAKTGNELGLTEAEVAALSPTELASKLKRAYEKLSQAGAHYVVDGIGDVPAVVAHLNTRLARGEKP